MQIFIDLSSVSLSVRVFVYIPTVFTFKWCQEFVYMLQAIDILTMAVLYIYVASGVATGELFDLLCL